MSGDEVLIRREGVAGILSLNRPKAIHALTLGMCQAMTQALDRQPAASLLECFEELRSVAEYLGATERA